MTQGAIELDDDPIIGGRHIYYLGPWENAANETVLAIFSRESNQPSRPVCYFKGDDYGDAFEFVTHTDRLAQKGLAL